MINLPKLEYTVFRKIVLNAFRVLQLDRKEDWIFALGPLNSRENFALWPRSFCLRLKVTRLAGIFNHFIYWFYVCVNFGIPFVISVNLAHRQIGIMDWLHISYCYWMNNLWATLNYNWIIISWFTTLSHRIINCTHLIYFIKICLLT